MRPRWQHFRDALLFVTTMTRLFRILPEFNAFQYLRPQFKLTQLDAYQTILIQSQATEITNSAADEADDSHKVIYISFRNTK